MKKHRHEKKINSKFAADICVSNIGGSILWIGEETKDGERVKAQEEIGFTDEHGFSRVMQKKLYSSRKGSYVLHKGRRYYLNEFYRR